MSIQRPPGTEEADRLLPRSSGGTMGEGSIRSLGERGLDRTW